MTATKEPHVPPPHPQQGDSAAACGTDKLTPGTVVHEAELSTTPDGLHFDEIKLGAAPIA